MALASRSKRSENCAADTLMATSRLSRGSLARYTSPTPPAPINATMSYGPNRVPAERGISLIQLSVLDQRASVPARSYALMHSSYLVRADAKVQTSADADRA